MNEVATLESADLRSLLEKLPACLRFATPRSSESELLELVEDLTENASSILSSLAEAEWAEHIASIDQSNPDITHASRQREIANQKRITLVGAFAQLLGSLDSQEASAVARTAIRCEISAIHARRRGSISAPIERIAEFQTAIAIDEPGPRHTKIVEVYSPIYELLVRSVEEPEFLYYFSKHPRRFKLVIADCYFLAGWEHVELTPQRGDRGRDIIATRTDIGTIRILEQTKAYSPGTRVTHDDVRAMIGVLGADHNASKGIITTTADFQPNVMSSSEFTQFMPFRLELRNGNSLRGWLANILANPASRPRR